MNSIDKETTETTRMCIWTYSVRKHILKMTLNPSSPPDQSTKSEKFWLLGKYAPIDHFLQHVNVEKCLHTFWVYL